MKVLWIIVAVYVFAAFISAFPPECFNKAEPRFVEAHEVPLLVIIAPLLSLLVRPLQWVSSCPEPKYEDYR